MNWLLSIFRFLWKVLNFVRNLVMNIIFILFVAALFTIIGLYSNFNQKTSVELAGDQGALLLSLDGYLADNRDDNLDWINTLKQLDSRQISEKISTFDVVQVIRSAMDDDKIKGLVLDLSYFEGADLPALQYIGKAINEFKQSKKPVIAMSDNYTQTQYFLASYADKIYLNSAGDVDISGLSYQNVYFKSMLDKLQATPHVFRVGTYKSAVEPFLRDNMSAEAKENTQRWLGTLWQNYQQIVSQNRGIAFNDVLPESSLYLSQLKALKGDLTAYTLQRKLITNAVPRALRDQELAELFGEDPEQENSFKSVSLNTYLKTLDNRFNSTQPQKIAVVNVEGVIVDGESEEGYVGSETIATLLQQANDDEQIKAVVLRVNSPGGSAFASEIIRQEVDNLQQSGKPVVVSMGNLAASGGYWISSTADFIVADQNTITGSIGIFAVLLTLEKSLDKIGFYADGINTSELAGESALTKLAPERAQIIQLSIENGYERFLSLVHKGRKLPIDEVDKLAQGQIWLGSEAHANKLVDAVGDFDVAIEQAKALANAKLENQQPLDYGVEWIIPKESNLLKAYLKGMKGLAKNQLQTQLASWFGIDLIKPLNEVKQKIGELDKFNDPKGQYLYCLNCGTIK